jgi:hypothetical protein
MIAPNAEHPKVSISSLTKSKKLVHKLALINSGLIQLTLLVKLAQKIA